MKMKSMILATAATLILAPALAMAHDDHNRTSIQYNGPVDVVTVDSLLQDTGRFVEKDVVVEGNLLRQIRRDTFVFSDGKGEIQVELDDDLNLAQPLDASTKVRLFGEYEGGNTPEIEVDHIQIL